MAYTTCVHFQSRVVIASVSAADCPGTRSIYHGYYWGYCRVLYGYCDHVLGKHNVLSILFRCCEHLVGLLELYFLMYVIM